MFERLHKKISCVKNVQVDNFKSILKRYNRFENTIVLYYLFFLLLFKIVTNSKFNFARKNIALNENISLCENKRV